ncbi:MAG TPA: hypothetical protein PKD90_04570 [Phnomibacter sp.]|nr:hypothetical protein [Phnomibacter sp.]
MTKAGQRFGKGHVGKNGLQMLAWYYLLLLVSMGSTFQALLKFIFHKNERLTFAAQIFLIKQGWLGGQPSLKQAPGLTRVPQVF